MKKIIFIILIVAILVGGYFLIQNPKAVKKEETVVTEPNSSTPEAMKDKDGMRVINISARKFEFSPNVINVKRGEKIKLVVEDSDIKHGVMVPELLFPPSQSNFNEIDLKIDKEGEYVFYCTNEICGNGHGIMKGKIIVS